MAHASLVRTSCSDIAVCFRSNKNSLIPCIKFENHSSEGRLSAKCLCGVEAVFEEINFMRFLRFETRVMRCQSDSYVKVTNECRWEMLICGLYSVSQGFFRELKEFV